MAERVLWNAVWIDPDRMGGTPCFLGTRIPVTHLFDWLASEGSVETFSEEWDVPVERAREVIDAARRGLLDQMAAA